jgi:hypothetical protein
MDNKHLNNLELRNAINQVPGIGNILDYILVNLGQGFQQRRLIQTMKDLREEMTQINEAMIDQSFLTTEEFCDILRKTIESCLRTRHNKIRLYCKILAGSVILDNKDERHSVEDFLSFISELSPIDLLVGLEIYKQQKIMPEKFDVESNENTELKFIVNSGWHNICNTCGLNEADLNIALAKLSRAGLIKEIVGMYLNYTGGLYLITPAFKKLMYFIRFSSEPTFNYKIQQTENSDPSN